MHRVCPLHRVELLVVGDELRCPAAPHAVVAWLVVDRRGRVWAAATRKRVFVPEGFKSEWPTPVTWEPARPVGSYPPAA